MLPTKVWALIPSPPVPVSQPHCGGKPRSGTNDIQYVVPACAEKGTPKRPVYRKVASLAASYPRKLSPKFPEPCPVQMGPLRSGRPLALFRKLRVNPVIDPCEPRPELRQGWALPVYSSFLPSLPA